MERLSEFREYDLLATARQPEPVFEGASGGYQPLDITVARDVRRVFEDFTPDVVVNCAAMTHVDACEEDKETCWKANVDGVELLARHCLIHGAHLIQVSTDFVFDGKNGPYRETDRPKPLSFYGKSKLAAENAARGAGLDAWSIARTVLVYGDGRPGTRSDFVRWVVRELSANKPIRVVTDQFRTPTYVPDLANGIERLIRFGKVGTYHVSGRELLSVYDMALRIASAFDLDKDLIHPILTSDLPRPAERPLKSGFLILKAESELGYRPTPLDDSLKALRAVLSTSPA
ncbi:MAG: SDR family oxidoreductase [Rhodothermales bacterium]|nr:SDR family oxidoreductase [Rhodothermales bacterium]MBO6779815.1 SDR family oxidoreductase [Rhodothermales bacterium]